METFEPSHALRRQLMDRIVAPVRYPLRGYSRETLAEAVRLADEHDATLTVLHVDSSPSGHRVTPRDLEAAVEATVGPLPRAHFVVRDGLIVKELLVDEITAEGADTVVVGGERGGLLGRLYHRLVGDPNIDGYLRRRLRCEVITVPDRHRPATR